MGYLSDEAWQLLRVALGNSSDLTRSILPRGGVSATCDFGFYTMVRVPHHMNNALLIRLRSLSRRVPLDDMALIRSSCDVDDQQLAIFLLE